MPHPHPRTSKYVFLLSIAILGLAVAGGQYVKSKAWAVLGISTSKIAPAPMPTFRINAKPWPLHNGKQIDTADIPASALFLVDEDTGTVMAARNADQPKAVASITKMMTAAITLEFANPDSDVIVPRASFNDLPPGSTMMGITTGETYTIKELLQGMLLTSGNEAANALALSVSGSQAQFVALMNGKAQQLQLQHTHFTNPSGLDEAGHYSSARDLAIIAHYARSFSLFRDIVATPEIELPYSGRHKYLDLKNLNTLLDNYPGATGIKPGNTDDAGNCLVGSATRNGHHLIGVLLDTPARSTNMGKLLDAGFATFQ